MFHVLVEFIFVFIHQAFVIISIYYLKFMLIFRTNLSDSEFSSDKFVVKSY